MDEGDISDEAVRRSLERILASPQFNVSPRQSQLLSYLVEEKLAGRADQLKGYTIAVDVFGKDDGFDPSEDSIVRVHMSRLRALLKDYYSAHGSADDSVIVLRPGAYAPEIEKSKNTDTPPGSKSVARRRHWFKITPERIIIVGLVALNLGMFFWDDIAPRSSDAQLAANMPEGPSIAVASYRVNGTKREIAQQLRSGLQHEVVSYLSQLPNLAVLGHDTVDDREFATPEERRVADFVLVGTITVDDTSFVANSSLIRTSDQQVVWSQISETTPLNPASFLSVKSDIALAIAAELGEPYGVIHQAMRNTIDFQRETTLSDYFCELGAYDYMRTKDPVERDEVRKCLNRAIERTPRYSDALALLAWIFGEEGRLAAGRGSVDGDPEFAKRSLQYAERAVQVNTTNAMAYSQLALAQFFNGNDAAAEDAIERALRMSPNNTEILANAAWLYASWGDDELSSALSDKAITLNPSHPPWYWLGPALRALVSGRGADALRFAQLYRQEDSLHARYVMAAALRLNGRGEDADQILADAHDSFGLTREELESNIQVWRLPAVIVALAFGD